MSEDSTSPTRGKRRPTTSDQRRRPFEVYEETNRPRQAAVAAHVEVSTLCYWRKRFEEEGGYPALEQPRSHRPHTFARQLPEWVGQKVIGAKREHPAWGRRHIADELRKAHGPVRGRETGQARGRAEVGRDGQPGGTGR